MKVDPTENARFMIHADRGKITQIVGNLVDNAMKYTPRGGVEIILESDDLCKTILLKISDTGIGMDKEDIGKLFQKFSRAQNAPAAASGIGLGLYLVATIAKAHEGKVWAESAGRGKGATFFLELPVAKSNKI